MGRHINLAPDSEPLFESGSRRAPIRVVLAEPQPRMRSSLRDVLDRADGIEVVAEAADLDSAIRQVWRHQPDVLAIALTPSSGPQLATLKALHVRLPGPGIVALTMNDAAAFARRALEVGASAVVLKDRADAELPVAVRRAADARKSTSPRIGPAEGEGFAGE